MFDIIFVYIYIYIYIHVYIYEYTYIYTYVDEILIRWRVSKGKPMEMGTGETINKIETIDPRPETWDLRPGTWDLRPDTWDLRPETWDLRPETWDLRPETRDPRPETWDLRPETRDPRPETWDLRPETWDLRPPFGPPVGPPKINSQKINKSYFRHSETFASSKLISFQRKIRFSRSQGSEGAKMTHLSPLPSQKLKLMPISFFLYFKAVQITFFFCFPPPGDGSN